MKKSQDDPKAQVIPMKSTNNPKSNSIIKPKSSITKSKASITKGKASTSKTGRISQRPTHTVNKHQQCDPTTPSSPTSTERETVTTTLPSKISTETVRTAQQRSKISKDSKKAKVTQKSEETIQPKTSKHRKTKVSTGPAANMPPATGAAPRKNSLAAFRKKVTARISRKKDSKVKSHPRKRPTKRSTTQTTTTSESDETITGDTESSTYSDELASFSFMNAGETSKESDVESHYDEQEDEKVGSPRLDERGELVNFDIDEDPEDTQETGHEQVLQEHLAAHQYYHGFLTRHEMPTTSEDNEFFIRSSKTDSGETTHFISFQHEGVQETVTVRKGTTGAYYLKPETQFKSINDLVDYYTYNDIGNKQGARLITPLKQHKWQLQRQNINMENSTKLGEGAYGEVRTGLLTLDNVAKPVTVAVKFLRTTCINTGKPTPRSKLNQALREAHTMRDLVHRNVVRLYGVVTDGDPLLIVMELVIGESLNGLLRSSKGKQLNTYQRIDIITQIASGLAYLHYKNILHRDLSARNCIVDQQMVVKLTDFGLAHQSTFTEMSVANGGPIRWSPPEVLKEGLWTEKADVVCWEVWSDGADPYATQSPHSLVDFVKSGKRMTLPSSMPHNIQMLVKSCWADKASSRPTSNEIHNRLKQKP